MGNPLMQVAIQAWFLTTGRDKASGRIRRFRDRYLELARRVEPEAGRKPVKVPWMPGVDPDMRDWSFFMILDHNAIVNRSITSIVESLARGEEPTGAGAIDPKKDVMPSPEAGEEAVIGFKQSVERHLEIVSGLGRLRGTRRKRHTMFGEFDAHRWHCMFGFHLMVHYRQAEQVAGSVTSSAPGVHLESPPGPRSGGGTTG